jgi:hypothetical protein
MGEVRESETSNEVAIHDSLGRRLCAALGTAPKKRHAPKVRFNGWCDQTCRSANWEIDRTVLQKRALLSRAFSATPLFGSVFLGLRKASALGACRICNGVKGDFNIQSEAGCPSRQAPRVPLRG